MPFKKIGLTDALVQGILATGYKAPTEIQSLAIPAAVAGKDVIACAQTGTGKTAAFVLPILNRLSQQTPKKGRAIKALILTPTRELAEQIEQAIQGYGRFMKLRSASVYGGVKIQKQFAKLRNGVDILVSTPGRLLDHMQRGTIDLRKVEVLVLDEADRMLDMGFVNDVKKIVGPIPKNRQTLLFSATMSKQVTSLASTMQNKTPKIIQVGEERNPIDTITQHIYPVPKELKMHLLLHILKAQQLFSVLIFSRTKHGADKIARRLKKEGVKAVAIHSNRTQSQRQQALDGFKKGKFYVMVATDIAARGIDVQGISHVINYDVPTYSEDYIHRIGRTGRAQSTGDAITFVSQDESKYLRRIEQYIGRKFKTEKCEGFDYSAYDFPEIAPLERKKPSKGRGKPTSRRPASRGGYKSKSSAGSRDDRKSYGSARGGRKTVGGAKSSYKSRSSGSKEESKTSGGKKWGGKSKSTSGDREDRKPSSPRNKYKSKSASGEKSSYKPKSAKSKYKPKSAGGRAASKAGGGAKSGFKRKASVSTNKSTSFSSKPSGGKKRAPASKKRTKTSRPR
jgi:ATP-dependent RNA helicase RhlE